MSLPYRNRQLFSDHWLHERLKLREEYALTPLPLTKLSLWLRRLVALHEEANDWGARETLERAVAPCLALLGYAQTAQTAQTDWLSLRLSLWSRDADLLWQSVPAAAALLDDAATAPRALVGVAPWPTELDSAPMEGGRRAQTPALAFLRQLAKAESVWGILTNGRQWRLYYRDGAAVEASYEVDLPALAADDDVDELHYFSLFFAAQAQLPPAEGAEPFLQVALRESREYAARIEDDLRERAFEAIQAACQALADALAGERAMSAAFLTRDDLAEVYGDALALLYRLLFVLYAESRDLLPTGDPVYAAGYSLRELIAALPAKLDALPAGEAGAQAPIWPRLARLFRALNGEESSSVVPAFSGRLFDDDLHPLLARLTLADAALARMLILLGRTRDGRQIDYADLSVRQLGSIYEGLLEHQAIAVAVEEMALAKGPKDKAALLLRRADVGERRVLETYPTGTVYLANDRSERHAAGTYYSPEPVVRYLVEETLGPLVADKTAEQILTLRVLDPAMGSAHFLVAAVDYLTRAALAARENTPSPTATAARATKTAQRLSNPTNEELAGSDVLELKRRIAEQCVYGVDVNEAAVELGKLSLWLATAAKDRPLTFLDLHLRAGNSLMGLAPGELESAIDRAPTSSAAPTRRRTATAKTAKSATNSKPPAVSDHSDLWGDLWNETAYTQTMFKVVGAARVVDLMPTDSVAAVRSKLHVFGEIEREMRRYREAADLAVSLRLGVTVTPEEYRAAMQTLLGQQGGFRLGAATLGSALEQAQRIRERHALFHWELEFPEVFRDGNGQPLGASGGFDAILGNPPYVSVTTLRASDPVAWAYYPQVFQTTTQGKYDLYVAFVERALALLNARGRLAYILPNKWLTTDFGAPLRELLATRHAARALVDFGALQVFPGVSNYTCLLFAGSARAETIAVTKRTAPEGEIELPPAPHSRNWIRGAVEASTLGQGAWNLTVGGAQAILDRWRDYPTLGEVATVFVGTCTNANPVFIVYELERDDAAGVVTCLSPALNSTVRLEAALLHPVLQGRDIQPYSFDGHGALLLSPYRLADGRATLLPADDLRTRYPLIWAYLNDATICGILEAREHGRFRGRDDWYGFGRPQNMSLLPEPKLVLPDVAARGRVAWDATGHDIVDTAYGITLRPSAPAGDSHAGYTPEFLLAALNSPILTFFLRQRGTDLRGGYFRMKTAYLNPFPLPPLGDAPPQGERSAQARQGSERALAAIRAGTPAALLVTELERLSPATLHDVVSTLAGQVSDLAAGEQQAWRRFTSVVLGLRGGGSAAGAAGALLRYDERLRFERAHEMETPDALIAAFAAQGRALTAPELGAIRTAHREARTMLLANRRGREATVAVVDRLLYQMYALGEDEIALVEGSAHPSAPAVPVTEHGAATVADATQRGADGVSYGSQRKRRSVAGAGERSVPQETQDAMREITKGGQPDMVVRSVAQTLANPYSDVAEINGAMGYTPASSVGPHYLNTAVLAGLLTETPQGGWFRPTEAGRRLLLAAPERGAGQSPAFWDALLAMPAFRCYLEYKILTLIERSRRYPALTPQIEAAAFEAFPEYRSRAVSLQQMLRLPELRQNQVFDEIRNPPALEPVGWEALRAWTGTMGLGPSRSDLTRASEIGKTLARAAQVPVCVRSEWLTSAQLLALALLIAARQRSQGIALPDDGANQLAQAVEALRRGGLDIRLERRGRAQIAALLPAVTLRIASASTLEGLTGDLRRWPEMARIARVIVGALSAGLRAGVDGEQRSELTPGELANACSEALEEGLGTFVSVAAADEMPPVEGMISLGPPAPLATDAIRLGRDYRFFAEAMRAQARGQRRGVAVLLSEWLTRQRQMPQQELAVNPHLALLYLIAADIGGQAERLARRDIGWLFAGEPLARALDDRLRGLGYEVWDEGYCRNEQRAHALGAALVEQGVQIGVLSLSSDPSSPLEAPANYGYYEAMDLLAVEPASRQATRSMR